MLNSRADFLPGPAFCVSTWALGMVSTGDGLAALVDRGLCLWLNDVCSVTARVWFACEMVDHLSEMFQWTY